MQAPLVYLLDFLKDFILYVSASTYSVARVLIQELNEKRKHVIYYISKILSCPINYSHDEKLTLILFFSSHRLHHYILTHKTKVVTNFKLMQYMLGQQ